MKKYNVILIALSLVIYFINKLNRLLDFALFNNIYVNNHLNDVLAAIVILAFSNVLLEKKYRMIDNLLYIEIFVFCSGVFWEFVTPLYKTDSVSDVLDLVAYCLGGLVYWIVVKSIQMRRESRL